jgi:hypothetical protein
MMDFVQLEREQERDQAASAEVVKAAEQKLAAISPDLRAEVANEKRRAIREQALQQVAPRRNAMIARAEQARAALPRYTVEAILRNARFADDPVADASIRSAKFQTLVRAPTPALQSYLEDEVAANSMAGVEVVRAEYMSRTDRSPEVDKRFQNEFAKLKVPQAENAHRALNRIIGLVDVANVQLAEFTRGRSDPMARIAAHRAAGAPRAA